MSIRGVSVFSWIASVTLLGHEPPHWQTVTVAPRVTAALTEAWAPGVAPQVECRQPFSWTAWVSPSVVRLECPSLCRRIEHVGPPLFSALFDQLVLVSSWSHLSKICSRTCGWITSASPPRIWGTVESTVCSTARFSIRSWAMTSTMMMMTAHQGRSADPHPNEQQQTRRRHTAIIYKSVSEMDSRSADSAFNFLLIFISFSSLS